MRKSKSKPLSKRASHLVNLFEKGELDPRIQQMREVRFDVDIRKVVHLYAIDDALDAELEGIARKLKTSSEKLVERWIKEKLRTVGRQSAV